MTSKVALITGASRGIGKAIATRLANDGFAVVVNYANRADAAMQVVEQITAKGQTAIALQADIGEPESVQKLYQQTIAQLGRVDVVVNNAGIMPMGTISAEHLEDFQKTIATNLQGTYLMMAYACEYLREGGRFIALSSSVIAKKFPGYGPYIASKAGVEGLVGVFANEMRGRNICVNAVAPGPVATELFLTGKSDEQIEQLSKIPPLERLGQPEDISSVVSFLSGDDGQWVNGQVLRANGGFA
ncbi:SDR family oxidoreductase [Celerinatantimonas sp. MCCC 1A17872]|uniref:SDR family oxidoreductase n=1 Tax=Celerinatantimonas sp. MCCC 1A17872 TaxID=3177514 RepID=UPI0038CBA343